MKRIVLALIAFAVLVSAGDAFCRTCNWTCTTIGNTQFCTQNCY